ncbi:MAG TPA: glycosyltransferase N-terminal domain-containing protein [Candidatus Marinimicrobia bacterium]|nr:glycosyltransferase N-terminal domain-containing protein [Candidatus Neomarinimicrobiota bacterium]HRS50931.1 glycosyltransferase N-terminal domain-containing protein [Candidatus Neomarinimicrobiota bacterium]HRU91727.1 glycosyltransferase N-terminal domain-containing protein [Candidatus Neomarinimicrobiota bacterium]
MTIFWLVIYNAIVMPIAYSGLIILSYFNSKIKEGLDGRQTLWLNLQKFREEFPKRTVYLVHSASLGEFEQAKPVIRGLKTLRPDILLVASFTSPSGFKNAERMPEVDLFTYLPFDTFLQTRRFLQKLRPAKIIFVTYELWPNLIFHANRYKIKTYLISARIRPGSSKLKPIIRNFFADLYRSLDYIYAISEEHKQSVLKLIGSVKITVLNLGDTRYDQVIERSKLIANKMITRIFDEGFVFIGGSIWPQDARHLLPALYQCLENFPDFKIILAPHEPNDYALEMLEDEFQTHNIETIRYSQLKGQPSTKRVVLIDQIGILAELYHQANLAFVGGSFRGSIHNVMEPAVAGLPVLFGPSYHNSQEAELLVQSGGGLVCLDESNIYSTIKQLMTKPDDYQKAARSARQVILENMGASSRTVREILESE